MSRAPTLLVVIALTACGSELNLGDNLPPVQVGTARPVDSQTHTDVIVQTVNPSVDILYMVDNSCSMGDDQEDLVNNFPTFMQHFLNSGLDYHIGVVSSDIVDPTHKGRLQGGNGERWITADQNNQINRFTAMSVLGNSGASPEKGISGIYMSIEREGDAYNDGFFRDESALHTICVSDERDYSSEPPIGEFMNWYDGLKRSAEDRSFSAIESRAKGASGGGGKPYGIVTQTVGGVVWDIDQPDWSPALDVLGLRATGLKTEYFLSRGPVADTVIVDVLTPTPSGDYLREVQVRAELIDGTWQNGDWYYTETRNSITFLDFVPDELSRIEITYTVASSVVSEQL